MIMKELSIKEKAKVIKEKAKAIKEKAKAYDKALEMAKKLIENEETNVPVFYVDNIKDIFPELEESEDEKVRKALISILKSDFEKDTTINDISVGDIITWLEKQKNCEYIKKDWLEHIKQSWYKEGFIDGKYTPKEWTINDATTLNEIIDFLENGTAKPQHDLTLYANWLKTQFSPIEKQVEHNLDWGEEDEHRIELLKALCEDKFLESAPNSTMYEEMKITIGWLKSLKDRVQPKQERSEEMGNRVFIKNSL